VGRGRGFEEPWVEELRFEAQWSEEPWVEEQWLDDEHLGGHWLALPALRPRHAVADEAAPVRAELGLGTHHAACGPLGAARRPGPARQRGGGRCSARPDAAAACVAPGPARVPPPAGPGSAGPPTGPGVL
jgi:hypothetical protein